MAALVRRAVADSGSASTLCTIIFGSDIKIFVVTDSINILTAKTFQQSVAQEQPQLVNKKFLPIQNIVKVDHLMKEHVNISASMMKPRQTVWTLHCGV